MSKINNPLEGALRTFAEIGTNCEKTKELRKDVFNTKVNGITVDTCIAFDTDEWETGINREGEWIIVEEYPNRDTALKGHNKWKKKIKANPQVKLQDTNNWNF